MKKLFIISALIIASLCSCIKGSKLVILAAEEDEYNKCREQQHRNRHGVPGEPPCYTGNSFFTESDRTEPTLYDMELYLPLLRGQKLKFAIIMRFADILVRKFN
ncbi:MAG: hypothetical protein MJY53_02075 [Bacteroidales bacterium]|nr:hypothetical protein [Bacteroidales bacterium]